MCCHFNVVYCSHFLLDVTCRDYGKKVFLMLWISDLSCIFVLVLINDMAEFV